MTFRHLVCHLDKFRDGQAFDADIVLYEEPQDSMVIATPFAEDKKAFYYNQKIVGMRAKGTVTIGTEKYILDPAETFGYRRIIECICHGCKGQRNSQPCGKRRRSGQISLSSLVEYLSQWLILRN